MKISAILDRKGRDVQTIRPQTPMVVALHRMESTAVGCLVVVNDDGRPVGVLSERDVVTGLVRHEEGILSLHARDVAAKFLRAAHVVDARSRQRARARAADCPRQQARRPASCRGAVSPG